VIVTGESIYGEIIKHVEKEGIDLIVIGTRGRSGIKKLLLGSTASGVVTYCKLSRFSYKIDILLFI
jgi:nucleotide-binding universal stress UspA family protein